MGRIVAAILIVLAGTTACIVSQKRIDAARSNASKDELLYLPNEKLLTHFTAGMSSVVADLIWLKTIQYTSEEFHNPQRKFLWLDQLCRTVTRLDPNYAGAYSIGGMLMAAIGSDDKALAFLKEGALNNPYSEEIPFEMAKVWLLNRYQQPHSSEIATYYLRMVAQRSDHPEYYLRWIRGIQEQQDPTEGARAMWQDILENTDDELTAGIARTNLRKLKIETNLILLRERVAHYENENGTRPDTLQEAVSPEAMQALDDADGDYFIDAEGQVKNSWLLEQQGQRLRRMLNGQIQHYYDLEGHYPESLDDWAALNGVPLPEHPDASKTWSYDPASGTVQ